MKLVFETAVVQPTRTKLLRGSWNSTAHRCPRFSNAHIWEKFDSIMPNHLTMPNSNIFGALLELMVSYISLWNFIRIKLKMAELWAKNHMPITLVEMWILRRKTAKKLSVCDNRKSYFTEWPIFLHFLIFSLEIFRIGVKLNFAVNLRFWFFI